MKQPARYLLLVASLSFLLHSHAASSVLSIEKDGTDMVLAWDGESRLVYGVEHSLDLDGWTNGSVSQTGDGSRIQLPVSELVVDPDAGKAFFRLQTRYQENEEGTFQDMLTPAYYNATAGDPKKHGLVFY
jgi:hypothetical protein